MKGDKICKIWPSAERHSTMGYRSSEEANTLLRKFPGGGGMTILCRRMGSVEPGKQRGME